MPNPKLQYDAKVPAFLRQLKGELSGSGERSQIQHARPKKELIDHDDDAPTYVDETNESVTKEEFERMAAGEDLRKEAVEPSVEASSDSIAGGAKSERTKDLDLPKSTPKDQAVFGVSAKRKLAKVVGSEGDAQDSRDYKAEEAPSTSQKVGSKKTKKPAKKKRIKLSFDEDGEPDV